MTIRGQLLCTWAGVASVVIFFIGFWPLAQFFPPLSPALSAREIAALYIPHAVGIKLGVICFLYSASLLVLFYSAISVQLRRIEREFGVLSISQIALGVLAVVPFICATVAYAVATFRADRDPSEILLLSDFGWIMLFMVAPPAMFQFFIIGYGILSDKTTPPILPRWLGYFTWWAAIVGVPGVVIVFFKGGPFAWSGLFGFYIPAAAFGIWTIITALALRKAILSEARDAIPAAVR
jgi:hypothetical protein